MALEPRSRKGFSLLEVMVALAILTVSLILLVQTQSSAVLLTNEAERIVTATDLAQMKMTDALLDVEKNGFGVSDNYQSGDFSTLGDDLLDKQFGKDLDDYHWEYLVTEVDIQMIGDLATAAQSLPQMTSGASADGMSGDAANAASNPLASLGALGIGPDMITSFLQPYVREIRVRVWWGKDSKKAEDDGTEVVLVTHVINPGGAMALSSEVPQ